jgi:hypothetical protein
VGRAEIFDKPVDTGLCCVVTYFDLHVLVELPGIEPVIETNVTCGNAKLTTRNNAKLRETTCGYAKGVDGVNTRGNERPAAPCTDGRLTAVVQTAGDEVGQPDHAGAADLFAQLAHPRNPFSD